MARCSVCGAKKSTPEADCSECSTARHEPVQLPAGVSLEDKTPRDPEAAPKLRVDPLLGKTVGNYRIESLLGTGGMGTVYRAFHPGLDRAAAIKVLRAEFSEEPGIIERFFREAKATNQIKHPGIVDIFDLGSMPNGRCYMVMELLEGESLEQYVKTHGALIEDVVTAFGRKVLDILAAAHQKQIIHRDLKPANIFLAKGANNKISVKLLDFGIAKILASRSGVDSTAEGSILGTPRYMPPEQARSPSSIDVRADVYSLGVVLYEMATGCPIFRAATPLEMMHKHQVEQPIPPRKIRPHLSKEFEAAIMCALSKEPNQRFKDCESFARALYTNDTAESLDDEGDDLSTLLDTSPELEGEISFAAEGGNTLDLVQPAGDIKQNSQSAIAVPIKTPHPAFIPTRPSAPEPQGSHGFSTDLDATPAPDKFGDSGSFSSTAPVIRLGPKRAQRFLWPIILVLSFGAVIGGFLGLQYLGALFASNDEPRGLPAPTSRAAPASAPASKNTDKEPSPPAKK